MIDPLRPLAAKKVAFVFGPGNISVDYAAALVRGPERALLELGGDVRTFNYAPYRDEVLGQPARRPWSDDLSVMRGVVSFFEEEGPFDLTLAYFPDVMLPSSVAEALKKRGGHLVNYPLNLLDQREHFTRALQLFDETFCAEEGALQGLRNARYVPMASDPWIFRPAGQAREPRVLFVGSEYGERGEWLARCAEVLPTTVSGSRFDLRSTVRSLGRAVVRERRFPSAAVRRLADAVLRDRSPVGDEGYVRLAAQHGVSVGFSDVKEEATGRTVHKVRLREYDAAMTGLCHLARRLPELERHFEPGQEMLLYDDPSELPGMLEQIKRGLIDFRAVGQAARKRAARDHTWTVRLRKAFSG